MCIHTNICTLIYLYVYVHRYTYMYVRIHVCFYGIEVKSMGCRIKLS